MEEQIQGWAADIKRKKATRKGVETRVAREIAESKTFKSRFKKRAAIEKQRLLKGYKGKLIKTKRGYKTVGGIKGLFKRRVEPVARRAKITQRVLGAAGISRLKLGSKVQRGAGRPHGSYKHGMPIHLYKRQQAQERLLMREQQMEDARTLARRGLTPEQIRELEYARSAEARGTIAIPEDSRRRQAAAAAAAADDELEQRRFLANKTVSPNTQRMLAELRMIQNKAQRDDVEQQRRIFERRLIAEQGNLLKTRNLFGKDSNTLNILETEGNILTAPSVFKEDPSNQIMRTDRFNIMQTREAGNNLRFF